MDFSKWPFLLAVLAAWLGSVRPSVLQEESTTRNFEDDFNRIMQVMVQVGMPLISDLVTRPEISGPCSVSLLKTFMGLRQQKGWALRMAMSNGLLSSNILEGSFVSIGGYEQCLNTRVYSSDGQLYFKGQYCSVYVDTRGFKKFIAKLQEAGELTGRFDPLQMTSSDTFQSIDIRHSICTPSLCTTEDIDFFLRSLLHVYGMNGTVRGCRTDDPKEITALQALSMAIICLLLVLVALGTTLEWLVQKSHDPKKVYGLPLRIMLMFSAITNTRFLLRTEIKATSEPIKFVSGLKVIMAFWVVLGHAYLLVNSGFFNSVYASAGAAESITFLFIPNGFLSVTTFFLISGFLLSYLLTSSREVTLKKSILLVYIVPSIRRYMRLTIPMLVVVLAAFLLPLMASGPADEETFTQMIRGCITGWWKILIHTNNFVTDRTMCLPHLWYVSADMQIFILVAFPLALFSLRFPKTACGFAVAFVLGFSALTSFQIHSWDLLYGFSFGTYDAGKLDRAMSLIYLRPFTHVGSYLIGVICGHTAVQYKDKSIHPIVQALLWLVSTALACFVLLATYPWNRGYLPDDIPNAIYGGFHRPLWAVAFFWPMYACATGRGGFLNGFFAWNFFIPISRLAFSIYLVQALVFHLRMMRLRTYLNADEFFQFTTSLGVFALSVLFGYVLHLTTEAPVIQLEKLIFEPTKEKKASETNGKPFFAADSEKSQL